MPYSVSVPITRRTLMSSSLMPLRAEPACRHALSPRGDDPPRPPRGPRREPASEVLPGVGHGVDRTAGLGAGLAGHQGPDVDDAFALLAGDTGPVVRIGGVRQ